MKDQMTFETYVNRAHELLDLQDFTTFRALLKLHDFKDGKNHHGQWLTHRVAELGLLDVLKIFTQGRSLRKGLKNATNELPIQVAIRAGQTECVNYLLSIRSDIKHCNYQRESCLHAAATSGNSALLLQMLALLPDYYVSLTTIDGLTPLDYAQHHGHVNCANDLRARIQLINAAQAVAPAMSPVLT